MELTASFVVLLQSFFPVFTAPTFQTFVQVVTGWLLSPVLAGAAMSLSSLSVLANSLRLRRWRASR